MRQALKAMRQPKAKANAAGMTVGTALSILLAWIVNDVVGYPMPDTVVIASTVLLLKVSWWVSHKTLNNGG